MPRIHLAIGAALLATALAASAQAQQPAHPSSTEPSAAAKVEHWTLKQWHAAKRAWLRDKAKWDACNQRASAQHLSGRKSWSFIYDCMKT